MSTPTDHLVDPRTGLVTHLLPYRRAGGPAGWVGVTAHVADSTAFAGWRADRHGFGASLGDPELATGAALGEAVERYCGNVVPAVLPVNSYAGLRARGQDAVDPAGLSLHSSRQHAVRGFPFVPFTRDLQVEWAPGEDLRSGAEVLVPASLVYLDFYRGRRRAQPPTNALQYAGIAAGRTREEAERSALEELLERDTTALWWASRAPARSMTGLDHLLARLADPRARARTTRFLLLPSELDVPVVAALVHDHEQQVVAFGTACRGDATAAATKALVEAHAVMAITLDLADPHGPVWEAVRAGRVPASLYRPFRADRRYRDDFAADLRDLVDLPAVAQLYLDPRVQDEGLAAVRGTTEQVRVDAVPGCGDDPRRTYLERLHQAGMRAVRVDLTTPDVRAAGLHVVRVVVPGLYNNASAAFPLLGGRRLYEVPVRRGWAPPFDETDVPLLPVPLP